MKRITFPLLVLALAVFASVPADAARKSNAIVNTVACLGGTVTWQPTMITGGQPYMPVLITYSENEAVKEGDQIGLSVDSFFTSDPACPVQPPINIPIGPIYQSDSNAVSVNVSLQPTSCGKALVYTLRVTCYDPDLDAGGGSATSATVNVQVISH